MRLVAGTIALTLFTSWATSARADDARDSQPPPAETSTASPRSKFPFRVVRVMPESRQALLFDRARSTHILVEVGQPVDGYRVDTIEDDEVTLSREGAQVVLAAPLHGPRNRARANEPRATPVYADGAAPRMTDAPSFAPLDPYGEPVRSASASDAAGEGGVRVTSAAGAAGDSPLPADNTVRTVRAPDSPRPASDGGLAAAAAALGLSPEPSAPVPSAPAPAPTASTSAPVASAPSPDPVAAAPTPYDAAPAPATTLPAPPPAAPPAPALAAPAVAPAASLPPPVAAAPTAPAPSAAKPSRKRAPKRAPAKPATQADNAQALADILSADTTSRRGPALSGSESAATQATTAPVTSSPALATTPAPSAAPSPAAPASPAPAGADSHTGPVAALSTSLARAEIDASLADFAKLSSALDASFSPAGVVLNRVDNASIFQRAGLRTGDTITAIDGVRLRSIDDAASLYARVTTASSITVQLQRGGKPVNLRVSIQ